MPRRSSRSTRGGERDPRLPPRPKSCVRVGRQHPKIAGSGTYRVCFTSNQLKRLFAGEMPREFRCGTFACTYHDPRTPTRLIKITEDAEDVSGLIAAQKVWEGRPNASRVPVVHDAVKLKQKGVKEAHGRTVPVYAMVVDKLSPVSARDLEWLPETMQTAFYALVDARNGELGPGEVDAPEVRDIVKESCPSRRIHGAGPAERCASFVDELLFTVRDLERAGVYWTDVHAGNIGIDRAGNWRVFDLGLSSSKGAERALEVLEGARRRASKLLRVYRRRRR